MAAASEPVTAPTERRRRRRWWTAGGAAIGLAAFAWVVARIDHARLVDVVGRADMAFVAMVPLAVAAEQLMRAVKWRQLLHRLRPIGTFRLFGAIMAGYFTNLMVPVGLSPIVRSWLVARLEALTLGAVLALSAASASVWQGMILLAVYSAGLAIPFLAMGLAFNSVKPFFIWVKRYMGIINYASGALLIVIGILIFTNSLINLNSLFNFGFLGDLSAEA